MYALKYPIGIAAVPSEITKEDINEWILIIQNLPNKLENLLVNLTDEQLNTTYRPDGWTIRQVIHHLGDSHVNSYVRFKWTLTEDKPIIKAYYEDRWVDLSDTKNAPINISLDFLKSLHAKWTYLLKGLTDEQLKKTFIHPEGNEEISLAKNIGIYAWHCEHHFEHINQLII